MWKGHVSLAKKRAYQAFCGCTSVVLLVFSGVKNLLDVNYLSDVGESVWLTVGRGSTELSQTDSTEAMLDLRFSD